MIKLTKNGAVKILDPASSLIQRLKVEGWAVEGEKPVDADLDALKAEAEALGLKVHHKAGADKLRELIAEAKAAE